MNTHRNGTCLGCGCTCDDVRVATDGTQIREALTECPLAHAWFVRRVPQVSRVDGHPSTLDDALDAVAARLRHAIDPVIAIGADVSCETQRAAVTLADVAGARLDGLTARHAAASVTAMQQYGRISATLGEFRRRADLVVFWGIDPGPRFPRLRSRYLTSAPDAVDVSRAFVAVDIGGRRGPADCDRRFAVEPHDELVTLIAWAELLGGGGRATTATAAGLADLVRGSRYVALIVDGESGDATPARLVAQAVAGIARGINGVTRGGVCTLRDGGNRTGADAVLTWQTGYPVRVDFTRGFPRQQRDAIDRADLTILVGRDPSRAWATGIQVAIGPAASETGATIAIDTGIAGIHEAGLAYRMDDVPVPLHALIPGPPAAAEVIGQLLARYRVTG